jgi:hypothetical protein
MNFFQKFRGFLIPIYSSKTTGLLTILVLVSAVFLTVVVAQRQQIFRQWASGNSTYFSLSPDKINSTDNFTTSLHLINNDSNKKITALDVVIKYDNNSLTLDQASPTQSDFTAIIQSNSPGELHYIAVNLTDVNSNPQGNDIPFLDLTFSAKAVVSGTVQIINAKITTSGNTKTAIKIADGNNIPASYKIAVKDNASTIAAMDTIVAALESGYETEADSFTGFGVINWLNMVQIYITGTKMKELDDQIVLYTALRNDMESTGKSMKEVLDIYRTFIDSKGKLNQKARDYFDAEYGSIPQPGRLLKQYDQECTDYIVSKIAEDSANEKNPEVFKCQTEATNTKNNILDFRVKEEKIITSSINSLTSALEKYNEAVNNGDNVDNLIAEIHYETASLLQTKANDDLANEYYTLVVKKFPNSPKYTVAKKQMDKLNSLGHKSQMFINGAFIGLFGLDTIIPFNPCKGPVKIACKFLAKKSSALLAVSFGAAKIKLTGADISVVKKLVEQGIAPTDAVNTAEVASLVKFGKTPDSTKLERAKKILDSIRNSSLKSPKIFSFITMEDRILAHILYPTAEKTALKNFYTQLSETQVKDLLSKILSYYGMQKTIKAEVYFVPRNSLKNLAGIIYPTKIGNIIFLEEEANQAILDQILTHELLHTVSPDNTLLKLAREYIRMHEAGVDVLAAHYLHPDLTASQLYSKIFLTKEIMVSYPNEVKVLLEIWSKSNQPVFEKLSRYHLRNIPVNKGSIDDKVIRDIISKLKSIPEEDFEKSINDSLDELF